MKIIKVEDKKGIPKYKQIVQSIENSIEKGLLKKDDKLPSVNSVCNKYGLSRDTVFTAFSELRARGIIYSIPGKGNYIKSTNINFVQSVFLLFDELNSFKEDLYNSLLEHLGKSAQVDIYFHHFNPKMFKSLIADSNGNYSSYIIMPANLEDTAPIINQLPKDKVFILDQMNTALLKYPGIYQNFSKDMYKALKNGKSLIDKYSRLKLVLTTSKQPKGMAIGFKDFAKEFNFEYEIITKPNGCDAKQGDVFVIPEDRDLVRIIKKAKKYNLEIGKDIGIISYNDTSLKEVVENGVTTISTDFKEMGKLLAEMVLKNEPKQIENKSLLIVRSTL